MARTHQERRDATSQAVLLSAVKLFGQFGFQKTSLEDITIDAGTTTRPVYHYFKNKKNLFLAAVEYMENQLLLEFEDLEAADLSRDLQIDFQKYWKIFIEKSQDPAFRQIVLIDAPNFLGRERWLDSPIVLKALDYFYERYPFIKEPSRRLIARMIVAALTEAAMVISETDDYDVVDDLQALIGLAIESLNG